MGNKRNRQKPGCSADDAFALICPFNQTPFGFYKLGDIADEWEDFAHTCVETGKSCQQVKECRAGRFNCF